MTTLRRPWESPWLQAFWNRAYKSNVTGMSAMVAYNLTLAIFPFALLLLFVVGQVIRSESIEASVLADVQRILPNAEPTAIQTNLDRIRDSSATLGIFAAVGGLWISASFWGALDTAFCRIYHVDCRGWVEQKRFSFSMLAVVIAFIAASLLLPTLEGLAFSASEKLPFGLADSSFPIRAAITAATFAAAFAIASVIYWLVPKGHMPWRSVWPGALFFTLITGLANFAFPLYFENSELGKLGGALGLILLALLWFYAIALTLLAGGVINSIRHEHDDIGIIPVKG